MLKSSTRNWAPNRSLNLKSLNTEKSTFLKPESRKMFRPIVPKAPFLGGTKTDLPFTKQPPDSSVPPGLESGATAVHCAHIAVDWEGEKKLWMLEMPLVTLQPSTPGPVQ